MHEPPVNINSKSVPSDIKKKLDATLTEADELVEEAYFFQKTRFSGKFSLRYEHSAPMDILRPFERAQSVYFVSRYEHLPILKELEIIESEGKFYLKNVAFIRHILNEYRSIIINKKDSVYYGQIHKFCYEKLQNRDPSKGLSITVNNEQQEDITETFLKILGERNKSINFIINKSEFGYIYNGILQHSDLSYTDRFWDEYYTGKLNYVFIKHAALLGCIKEFLNLHYLIVNQLTFPPNGPSLA